MRINNLEGIIELSNDESYIVSKSINELGGPYHSRFSKHLLKFHDNDYERLWNETHKKKAFPIKDTPLILETLYLLIHEMSDNDFLALYDGVTKEDVKSLYDKIVGISEDQKKSNDRLPNSGVNIIIL